MTMSALTPPLADSRDDGCSAPVALSLDTRRRVFPFLAASPAPIKRPPRKNARTGGGKVGFLAACSRFAVLVATGGSACLFRRKNC